MLPALGARLGARVLAEEILLLICGRVRDRVGRADYANVAHAVARDGVLASGERPVDQQGADHRSGLQEEGFELEEQIVGLCHSDGADRKDQCQRQRSHGTSSGHPPA